MENHLFRSLRTPEGIDFSSNDYLSLNRSGVIESVIEKVWAEWKGPIGSGGSRLIRGHSNAFERAEAEWATLVGSESALLFHSGYAANVGGISTLCNSRDTILCDRLAHATILDGIRLSGANRIYFEHNDLDDLEVRLRKVREKQLGRGFLWIMTESLFSMDGDTCDIKTLVHLAEKYDALIYLDEAHAVGVYGQDGAGLSREFADRISVRVYPCGKAVGLSGAFMCGSNTLITHLINTCRSFIFTTAQPPLLAQALAELAGLIPKLMKEREKLQNKAAFVRNKIQQMGFSTGLSTSMIIPVILKDANLALSAMEYLRSQGIDARAIRPPTVAPESSRLRINVQAGHSVEELNQLIDGLHQFSKIKDLARV